MRSFYPKVLYQWTHGDQRSWPLYTCQSSTRITDQSKETPKPGNSLPATKTQSNGIQDWVKSNGETYALEQEKEGKQPEEAMTSKWKCRDCISMNLVDPEERKSPNSSNTKT